MRKKQTNKNTFEEFKGKVEEAGQGLEERKKIISEFSRETEQQQEEVEDWRKTIKIWEQKKVIPGFAEPPSSIHLQDMVVRFVSYTNYLGRTNNELSEYVGYSSATGDMINTASLHAAPLFQEAKNIDSSLPGLDEPGNPFFETSHDKQRLEKLCSELKRLGLYELEQNVKKVNPDLKSLDDTRLKDVCYSLRDVFKDFTLKYSQDFKTHQPRGNKKKSKIKWKDRVCYILGENFLPPELSLDEYLDQVQEAVDYMDQAGHGIAKTNREKVRQNFKILRDSMLQMTQRIETN